MIRKTTAAVAAASLAALGSLAGLEFAGDASASSAVRTTRFVAHDIRGNLAMDDLAAPEGQIPGLGDMLAFTQRLTRSGKTVGRVSNVAVGVDAKRHLFHANGTITLKRGTVEFGGLVSQTPHFVLAVTGGTGRFDGADGTVVFDNSHGRQTLTLRLQR
jgi:hypothetical protein